MQIATAARPHTTTRTRAEWAERYIAAGYVPVPIPAGSKAPVTPGWQHRTFTARDFEGEGNIGLLTGARSSGLVDVDLDCPEAIEAAGSLLPPTSMVHGHKSKPASHYWYRVAGDVPQTRSVFADENGTLVELRSSDGSKGVQTIVPPSVHPSGEVYQWERYDAPTEIAADEIIHRVRLVAVVSLLARNWPAEGRRHEVSLALGGYLLNNGVDEEDVADIVGLAAEIAGDEEAEARRANVATTARKIAAGEPVKGGGTLAGMLGQEVMDKLNQWLNIRPSREAAVGRGVPSLGMARPTLSSAAEVDTGAAEEQLTDLGNACRLVAQYGGRLRYVPQWGWLVWDGKRWRRDETEQVMEFAKDMVRTLRREAADLRDGARARALWEHALRSESRARLQAMVDLARSDRALVRMVDAFDKDPLLLNVDNGTLDLRTSMLRPHRPEDHITKLAPINYDPEASSGDWDKFLRDIFNGNPELTDYMRRAVGYSLTGSVREPAFFIPWVSGRNGKSTFFRAVTRVLGDYAQDTPVQTFLRKQYSGGATNDQAALAGARLITSSETEANQTLDISLVKRITGGDPITARFLNKEFFTFTPQGKVWMSTNNKPSIPENNPAVWARIKLIPFKVSFLGREDKTLDAKLEAAAPAILVWAVRGAREWYDGGLQDPEVVTAATKAYQDEQDDLGDFFAERCVFGPAQVVQSSKLYEEYKDWARENGVAAVPSKQFTPLIISLPGRNISKGLVHGRMMLKGIGLAQQERSVPYGHVDLPF